MTVSTAPALRTYRLILWVAAAGVLLQGLWAGVFLQHDGARDAAGGWIDVHARTADLVLLLAGAATLVAATRLRARRDLWVGAGVLTVMLLAEAYLGGRIRENGDDVLTAVHIPLALVISALVVALPLRARDR